MNKAKLKVRSQKEVKTSEITRKETDPSETTCHKCNKIFSRKHDLTRHMASHLGQFRFWCDTCKKGFQNLSHYKAHQARHAGKTFPCQYCTKRFFYDYQLKSHQALHTGNYPYVCNPCQQGFVTKAQWQEHENQHAGIQFSCRNCSKIFSLANKRDYHEKSCGK